MGANKSRAGAGRMAHEPADARPKLLAKAAGLLALPKEITLNLPLITMTGFEEVNIENYKNIVEYTDTRVRINTSCGLLVIEGKRLRLKQITSENVTAAGEIESLHYAR